MVRSNHTFDLRTWHRWLRAVSGMMACCVIAWWLAGVSPAADPGGKLGAGERSRGADSDELDRARRGASSKQHIAELIQQLGHPRYTVRRAAATELRQIGADAFDMLHEATDDADPEIAASANYLLQEITVRWTRSDDSPIVRRALAGYGDQPEEQRLLHILALARLPDGEGTAGLCRIARFERSELLSREAAIVIIRPDLKDGMRGNFEPGETDDEAEDGAPAAASKQEKPGGSPQSTAPEIIDRELGESTRAASQWLRQYRLQLGDPAASLAAWPKLIDQEQQLLDQNSSETNSAVVLGLLWNLADVHRRLGDQEELLAIVGRMMELDSNDAEDTSVKLLQWFVNEQDWEEVDAFLNKYQDRLARAKESLYEAALARARQGKSDLAETLAAKASQIRGRGPLESVDIAFALARQQQFDWSVREYRSVIDSQQIDSHESIVARVLLSAMLHDHEQYKEAADVLEPLVKAIESKEGNVGQLYKQIQNFHERSGRGDVPELDSLITRYHFYLACHYEQQQDWKQQRKELEEAIRHDETDADVVIAMYRLQEADDAWRESTRTRILKLGNQFQQNIDENPNSYVFYNAWAWLVSNTEGDFQKAIRYSHRSLELLPNEPSLMDTLGRCYYAAGDYANAVKYQRKAVRRQPYLQVMQRQLALFEKALAEQQKGTGDGGRGSGESD